jgi:hypothetical protein
VGRGARSRDFSRGRELSHWRNNGRSAPPLAAVPQGPSRRGAKKAWEAREAARGGAGGPRQARVRPAGACGGRTCRGPSPTAAASPSPPCPTPLHPPLPAEGHTLPSRGTSSVHWYENHVFPSDHLMTHGPCLRPWSMVPSSTVPPPHTKTPWPWGRPDASTPPRQVTGMTPLEPVQPLISAARRGGGGEKKEEEDGGGERKLSP